MTPQYFASSYCGMFTKSGVLPKKKNHENVCFPRDALLTPGTPLDVSHFRVGDYVDVFWENSLTMASKVSWLGGCLGECQSAIQQKLTDVQDPLLSEGSTLDPRRGKRCQVIWEARGEHITELRFLRIDHEHQVIYV